MIELEIEIEIEIKIGIARNESIVTAMDFYAICGLVS